MSLVGLNTSLCAAAGGITTIIIQYIAHGGEEGITVAGICNGVLAGTVAITAPCNNVHPFAAIIIGIAAGFIYYFVAKLLASLEIDDPVDAVPLHGACGAWGVFSVGLFNETGGLFYGKGFKLLGAQVAGILAIALLSGVFTFGVMKLLDMLKWINRNPGASDEHAVKPGDEEVKGLVGNQQ